MIPNSPKNPICRKLNFDSPIAGSSRGSTSSESEFEADSNFPNWFCEGVDIDAKVSRLRETLIRAGESKAQPVEDPKSKFRTEYRRILSARDIVNDAIQLQKKEVEWLRNGIEMAVFDNETLVQRRRCVEHAVRQVKEKLSRLDSSVGIQLYTQKAVKSVLQLREDEYMPDDADANLNLPDEYQKYNNLSKLCDTALKSYDVVKKRNEEMQKELIALRNRQRKHQEAMRNLIGKADQRRVDEASEIFQNVPLENLRELAEKLKARKK
uniref:Uncharacterized protein n=1 Tax=Caenorhabditis japonica TaxID=281687 RepID=A0A8R1DV05_CAEJA